MGWMRAPVLPRGGAAEPEVQARWAATGALGRAAPRPPQRSGVGEVVVARARVGELDVLLVQRARGRADLVVPHAPGGEERIEGAVGGHHVRQLRVEVEASGGVGQAGSPAQERVAAHLGGWGWVQWVSAHAPARRREVCLGCGDGCGHAGGTRLAAGVDPTHLANDIAQLLRLRQLKAAARRASVVQQS